MEVDNQELNEKQRGIEGSILRTSTIIYAAMAGIGALIAYYKQGNLLEILTIPAEPENLSFLLAIGALGTGVLLIINYFFEEFFKSFVALKALLTRLLGPCSVGAIFYLSLISSIGEELLFRAAIQPSLGLVLTSFLFGLLHIGPGGGGISSWSLWAIIAGLLLGWMFQETGSLIPSLLCHFAVNFVSLMQLKRSYKKSMARIAPNKKAVVSPKDPT